jgi:hypothetical protein
LSWSISKKGQAEHIFSDALPGIALIFLGVIIIQVVHADVYEGLDRRVEQQITHAGAERQLVALLDTELPFEKTTLPFWQIVLEGRYALEHPIKDSRSPPFFYDDYEIIEKYPADVFDQIYKKDKFMLWYLLLRYDGFEEVWVGNAESLQDSCSRAYEAYTLDVVTFKIPDQHGHSVDVELHYCTLP